MFTDKYIEQLVPRLLLVIGLFFIMAMATTNHWLDPVKYATNTQFNHQESCLVIYHQAKPFYYYTGKNLTIIQGLHAHSNLTYQYANLEIKTKNNPVVIYTKRRYTGNSKLIIEDKQHNIIRTFSGQHITQQPAIISNSGLFKIDRGYIFINHCDYILIKNK